MKEKHMQFTNRNECIYENHYVYIKLPDNLFINQNRSALSFYPSGWTNSNYAKIATRIDTDDVDSNLYLSVKVFGNKGWQISINAINSFCQASEILIDINVQKWASKEWFECSGPYESDCISCNSGYVLEHDGSCVRYVNYLPTTNVKLYWICGLFAMVVTFIYLVLSVIYGRWMLEPAIHLQSLMMLVMSYDWVSSNWVEYLSWIQYFKFDFGFLNSLWLNYFTFWTPSDVKFANVKLYWQEIIYNYANIIIFAIFLLVLIILNKMINLTQKLRFLKVIKIEPQTIFLILWLLILPFVILNTIKLLYQSKYLLIISKLNIIFSYLDFIWNQMVIYKISFE